MKFLRVALLLAITCCSRALAATDPATLEAARALFKERGKSAEAQAAFEKIAAADSSSADAQFYLAQLALRRNDTDKAVAYADKAASLVPNNADYQHTLGDAYGSAAQKASMFSQFGLAKKCLAAYQRAVELKPEDVDFHQSLFEYYRSAPGVVGGGTDKALAEAATIKKLDAMRGRLCFATLYTNDKKYDLALAEFDEVLKAAPDDYAALYQVGKLAAVSGQYLDRGLASLRRCLELPPPASPNTPGHPAAHWRMGLILEKQNNVAGARAAYEAALKLDSRFSPAADSLKKLN
jgi:tetratricopeptide (TPR) repeat protein